MRPKTIGEGKKASALSSNTCNPIDKLRSSRLTHLQKKLCTKYDHCLVSKYYRIHSKNYLYDISMFPIRPVASTNLTNALMAKNIINMFVHPSEQLPNVTVAVGSGIQEQFPIVLFSNTEHPA